MNENRNAVGFALVSPVYENHAVLVPASEVPLIGPWAMPAGAPVCAPSRRGFFLKGENVWQSTDTHWYRHERRPRGDAHITMAHYFDDCNRIGGARTCDDAQRLPLTIEMIEAFKLKVCRRCAERLKQEMPDAELIADLQEK